MLLEMTYIMEPTASGSLLVFSHWTIDSFSSLELSFQPDAPLFKLLQLEEVFLDTSSLQCYESAVLLPRCSILNASDRNKENMSSNKTLTEDGVL